MARAPLLLSESLLFPYREGLSFEQDVWMDQGQAAAFTGTLDRPPTSTWEIDNPREYERGRSPAVPLLPDIHPLVDKLYQPYDIGQVGELDLHILTELFGGDDAARDLEDLYDYIELHDVPGKADHVLEQIEKGFTSLSENPQRGAYPKELLAIGLREYREIFFKPYRIIYRVMAENVYVLVITDGRRDMQALLQRRLLQA